MTRDDIIKEIYPFVQSNVPPEKIKYYTDISLDRILNFVADHLNNKFVYNLEFEEFITAASTTNYSLRGNVERALYFFYENAAYATQRYSYSDNVLILKNDPGVTSVKFSYLRKVNPLSYTNNAAALDLPSSIHHYFIELVKAKILEDAVSKDFRGHYIKTLNELLGVLNYAGSLPKRIRTKTKGVWLGQTGDGSVYDITNQYVSIASVIAADDQLLIVEDNDNAS